MIPFSGLSRFSGHFGSDGPSPLNRDTTVLTSILDLSICRRQWLRRQADSKRKIEEGNENAASSSGAEEQNQSKKSTFQL